MKIPAWTYSQLEGFETCPRQYYEVRVARNIPYVQGEQAKWGDAVHKALELRVGDGTPLPEGMRQWESITAKVAAMPGEKLVEGEFAIDKDFLPCGYREPNAWSRGKIDLTIIHGTTGVVLDWKTGKRKPTEQLELYSGYLFKHYPQLTKINTVFAWLKEKKLDKATITKEMAPAIWQRMVARFRRIEIAHERDAWPPKPSGLCRNYCSVTSCEFNGK